MLSSCSLDGYTPPYENPFHIKAIVENKEVIYEQTVFNGGENSNINVFNQQDKTLYLQVFKNGINDEDGFFTIRVLNVDIENLTLPYKLTGVEGSVSFVDSTIRELQAPCSNPDVLCWYSGVGVDEVEITITEIKDNVISGEFKGIMYHILTNPSVIRDTDDSVEVVNGIFCMKYISK